MTDDVVAELDRWLAVWSSHFGGTHSVDMEVVQRARDEIMALRGAMQHDSAALATLRKHARAEALEEAAMVADRWEERPEFDKAAAIAKAIRALKGPSDE